MKIIRTSDEELTEIAYEEYKLLKTIDHINIVKMYEAYLNQLTDTMYLVMDLLEGSNLKVLMQDQGVRFTENEAKSIFK